MLTQPKTTGNLQQASHAIGWPWDYTHMRISMTVAADIGAGREEEWAIKKTRTEAAARDGSKRSQCRGEDDVILH